MSTRSALGYIAADGKYRGTYIHHDGDDVAEEANKRIEVNGVDALIEWIEAGIAGNGYSAIDSAEPYGDGQGEDSGLITSEAYYSTEGNLACFWVLHENRVVSYWQYLRITR